MNGYTLQCWFFIFKITLPYVISLYKLYWFSMGNQDSGDGLQNRHLLDKENTEKARRNVIYKDPGSGKSLV